jgi:hypothetical protein
LRKLASKQNGGKWVTQSVCGSMGYISDQPWTWSGDDWRELLADNLLTIASHSGLRGATWANAYRNATDKLDRLNTTWDLAAVNPRLAAWYWEACRT